VDAFLKVLWSRDIGHGWSIGGMGSVFWLTEDAVPRTYSSSTAAIIHNVTVTRQTAHFGEAYKIGSNN
jgi:hypothetical protein